MPLETASTIADLVSTNPVGASDTPASLDDHLRLIKTVLQADAMGASTVHAATTKATPVDADSVGLVDTAASNVLKKLTWANVKATLKTYFDTLYQAIMASASQAEMEAGSEAGLRAMSPLRVKQAIDALSTSYADADALALLNASGSAPVYACRAWINFNGTGTPTARGSGNVASITDNGTGDYTINFTTAMEDANYCVVATTRYQTASAATQCEAFPVNSSSCRIKSTDVNGNAVDSEYVSVAVFR